MLIKPLIHYAFHFIVPVFIARALFKDNWVKAYLLMLATTLIDLDHLVASPIFAASYLMAKRLSFKESSMVIVGMLSLFVSMAQIPMVLLVWVTPNFFDVMCLGFVAILATTGHYAMTQSFRLTPMTISQPVTYLQLVWATVMGIYLFGDIFDIYVIIGGAMITLSATVIAYLDTRNPS